MTNSRRPASKGDGADSGGDDIFESELEIGRRQEKVRRLVQEIVSRWYWIMLFLVFGVLGSFYYLSKAPKIYTSQATVYVKQRSTAIIQKDKGDEEVDYKATEVLNTVALQMKRFELLKKVAGRKDIRAMPDLMAPTKTDLVPLWLKKFLPAPASSSKTKLESDGVPPVEELANSMSGWVESSLRRNSRLVDVNVSHPSPYVAQAIANAVVEEYVSEMLADRNQGRGSTQDILNQTSDQTRLKLQESQRALATYTRALKLLEELDLKETEVMQLSRRYKSLHPQMIAARGELDSLVKRFLEEFDAARSSSADKAFWATVEIDLKEASSDDAKHLATARQLLLSRSEVLKKEIESQNSVFNAMLNSIQESAVNQQSTDSEVQLSSSARLPEFPTSPKKPLVVCAGGLVGGMLGLALVMLLVRLDNRFHTVSQLESETGQAVLASVSAINPKHLDKATKKAQLSNNKTRQSWNDNLVFRDGVSGTAYAEMYRVLRASVSLLGDESRRKVTLFTSALPGEGKSLTSSNFALATASQGRKTLLIDLDLRKPSLHRVFGLNRTQHTGGVTECLAGLIDFSEAIYKDTGEENLHMMLAGKKAPNPGELLHVGKLQSILEQAAREYDAVVLDTAPLLAVPDTRVIAPLADHVCMVVRAEYVPKKATFRAIDLLAEGGAPVSGLVFNGFVERRRLISDNYSYGYYRPTAYGRGYRYGYGSYGTYGDDDEEEETHNTPKK
jgi:polysaccharide biosynthesis transport protein